MLNVFYIIIKTLTLHYNVFHCPQLQSLETLRKRGKVTLVSRSWVQCLLIRSGRLIPLAALMPERGVLDWENRQATCPQGKTSTSWSRLSRKSHPDVIKIQFSTTDCRSCPRLSDGVQSTSTYPRRSLVIRPQEQHAALQAARKLQQTETFQQRDALRAGVEATISQGVRAFDLRRSRYVGWPKTHVQHLA